MRAGISGRVAVAWNQTEVDGLEAPSVSCLVVGAVWSWRGQAMSVVNGTEFHFTRQQHGQVHPERHVACLTSAEDLSGMESGKVILTNGAQQFEATLVFVDRARTPTLIFEAGAPIQDQEFWISSIDRVAGPFEALTHENDRVVAFPAADQHGGTWGRAAQYSAATVGD